MTDWTPDNSGSQPPPPPPGSGGWQPQSPPSPPGGWSPSGAGGWSPSGSSPPSAPQANGSFNLAPLTVADILDLTFALLRKAWKQILIVVAVFAVPAGGIAGVIQAAQGIHGLDFRSNIEGGFSSFTSGNSISGTATGIVISGTLINYALLLFLKPYVNGAITRLVAAQYLGRDMSANEALAGVAGLYWRFVGGAVLVALCIACGLIALIIGAIPIAIMFTAVTPIIAIEEEGVMNAMGRSWALMSRRFWSYLLIRVMMYFIAQIAAFIFALVPAVIAGVLFAINVGPIGAVFIGIASVLSALVSFPIASIVCTLVYFDSRVRNEGFDLQMMAARLPQASTSSTPSVPPTAPQQ